MSVQEHNPFKVGDKVRLLKSSYDFNPALWKKYMGYRYSIVTGLSDGLISTTEDKSPQHYTHFDFYKEEKDMAQQTQQKTKRVPFTKESWKRNQTAKVIWTPTETEILYFAKWGGCGYDFIGVYKAPGEEYAASAFVEGDFPSMAIEIHVTTKRIPFNPELKDAKVFYGDTEMAEWIQMKSGVVCGSYDAGGFAGVITNLYHPNDLQMEIEE